MGKVNRTYLNQGYTLMCQNLRGTIDLAKTYIGRILRISSFRKRLMGFGIKQPLGLRMSLGETS